MINKIPAGNNVNKNGRGLSWGPVIAERDKKDTKGAELQ